MTLLDKVWNNGGSRLQISQEDLIEGRCPSEFGEANTCSTGGRTTEDCKRCWTRQIDDSTKKDLTGRIVLITGNDSVFEIYLGRYGLVQEYAYGNKWWVELNKATGRVGQLRHTISETDFTVVGELHDYN